jgi:hypothetical protein
LFISVSKTIEMLMPLLAIMIAFTCVYGLMGMQIFGFTFVSEGGQSPRLNFDSFRNSVFTLFQIITLDDWVSVICDGLQSNTLTSKALIIPYLLLFVIIECYVLLNLFVAVVVEKFELTNDTKEREQRSRIHPVEGPLVVLIRRAEKLGAVYRRLSYSWQRIFRNAVSPHVDPSSSVVDQTVYSPQLKRLDASGLQRPDDRKESAQFSNKVNSFAQDLSETAVNMGAAQNSSDAFDLCCCIPLQSKLRCMCLKLTQNFAFDNVVLFMVVASSILLAVESPDVTDDKLLSVFYHFNLFFLVFFTVEALLKSFALGWLMYISEWWNFFDLVVLALMLADLLLSSDLGYVRVFRTSRVLRSLKIMNKVPEIKHFIASLLDSWPELVSIGVGFTVFVFLWSVIGISLFAGKTRLCSGNITVGHDLCFGVWKHERSDFLVPSAWILGGGIDSKLQWSGSFDDIQSSVATLFEVSTMNNWGIIRAACVDSTAALRPPSFENSPWISLYFISFVFFAVFYLLNIVISTLVNTYRKKTGSAYRTEEQRLWRDMMRLAVALRPKILPVAPTHKFGRFVFDVVHSPRFELVSLVFIVMNALTLCLEYSSQSSTHTDVISNIHVAVTAELGLEVILQFIAAPGRRYFRDMWNVFDLVVVILSAVLGLLNQLVGLGILQALRVVRIVRIVRVARVSKTLQMTVLTLSMSYVYLATALLILMICIFIFAVLSFSLFGKVKYGRALNPDSTNFDNFLNSVFSLIVMSTSYEHSFVKELSVEYPYCTPDATALSFGLGQLGDCGHPVAASLVFPVFFFFSAHFSLSILSAVIVENFSICTVQNCSIFSRISWSDFETYRVVWMIFDPYCKGRISIDLVDKFVIMMARMGSQLGDARPTYLNIQCLKLYASRVASRHLNDANLTWDSLLSTHQSSTKTVRKCLAEPASVEDLKSVVQESGEAHKHVSFRGLLFCLALFKAEEACLTYTESLIKYRIVEFVKRKASVQLLEVWALKNLKRKALIKKYGQQLIHVRLCD